MRADHLIVLAAASVLVACGDAGSAPADAACHYVDTGECEPPAGSTALAVPTMEVTGGCWDHADTGLTIVDSQAQWDTMFASCMQDPIAIDFATQRLAIVTTWCTGTSSRFVVESAGTIVIGVHESQGGACIQSAVLVTLPRSTTPVRVAHCRVTAEGDCQPLA